MLILLILSLILLAAVLYLQYRRSRALRRAAQDLKDARSAPGTRLRLYAPNKELEGLLTQINGLLEDRERETRALRSRDDCLRRQIANVSHDLRTPLTSLLGYLQLLGSENLSQEERLHYLEIIEGRARVLQDLITSFYDLSRIEGGEYPLELQAVDLRRALERDYGLELQLLADNPGDARWYRLAHPGCVRLFSMGEGPDAQSAYLVFLLASE